MTEQNLHPNATLHRWHKLGSFVGVGLTLGGIIAEVSGYLKIFSAMSATVTLIINSIAVICLNIHFDQHTVLAIKIFLGIVVSWVLFHMALHSYSKIYEHTDLHKWIVEVRCFMKIPQEKYFQEVQSTYAILVVCLPLASVLGVLLHPFSQRRRIRLRGLEIHTIRYLNEVVFFHAVALSLLFVMAVLVKASAPLI